jgi:hypothetical protein
MGEIVPFPLCDNPGKIPEGAEDELWQADGSEIVRGGI